MQFSPPLPFLRQMSPHWFLRWVVGGWLFGRSWGRFCEASIVRIWRKCEILHLYLAAWEGCLIGFYNFARWSWLEVTLDNMQFGDCSSALCNYTESEFNVDSWHVLNWTTSGVEYLPSTRYSPVPTRYIGTKQYSVQIRMRIIHTVRIWKDLPIFWLAMCNV